MGIKGLQPETQGSTKQYETHWALTLTLTLITTLPAMTLLTPVALRKSQSPTVSSKTSPHLPPCLHLPPALRHLSLAGHTWVLQGDVNLGPDDIVTLLQGVGCHRCPLAAGVNEQDVSLTDALGILP